MVVLSRQRDQFGRSNLVFRASDHISDRFMTTDLSSDFSEHFLRPF